MPPHKRAYRPVVMGRRGAVASAHPLASMAGIQMLLAGGNAVDAAVAVASTLNVVEPFMSGVGGVGLMLLSRGSQRHVLDFIGRAPAAADPAACTDDELAGGPKACAIPGNLGGWLAAIERFGSMDRARVLAPAIDLMVSMLLAYRSLSDQELSDYVRFVESDAGHWYMSLLNSALLAAVDAAAATTAAELATAVPQVVGGQR